jgi:hypothetical protein
MSRGYDMNEQKITEEEMEKLVEGLDDSEKIIKEAAISWDGTNNVVRIPKEVSDFLDINEKNRKNKRMKFEIIEKNEQLTQIITIIDHEKK